MLLITSQHFGWVGLRSVLYGEWHLRVVGDESEAEAALDLAERHQPEVVFLPADGETMPSRGYVARLHRRSPRSRIIIVGEDEDDTIGDLLGLSGVRGYWWWRALTPRTILKGLAAILEADLWVANPRLVEKALSAVAPERPPSHRFTAQEEVVLRGLAAAQTEEAIAHRSGMSVRTVQRIVARLHEKLEARSFFVMGMRAHRLGFREGGDHDVGADDAMDTGGPSAPVLPRARSATD